MSDDVAVRVLSDATDVDRQSILDMWSRHGVVTPEEAQRRIDQVVTVATAPTGEVVGVGTAYLGRNAQLRLDMWHYRTFVAPDFRMGYVARGLASLAIQDLTARFVDGTERRGAGFLVEVENEVWGRNLVGRYPHPGFGLSFIGRNQRGHPVRVLYFPGARAAEPPA